MKLFIRIIDYTAYLVFSAILIILVIPFDKFLTFLQKRKQLKILKQFRDEPVNIEEAIKELFPNGLSFYNPPTSKEEEKHLSKNRDLMVKEARRLGGDIKWVQLPNGMYIYKELFFDINSLLEFREYAKKIQTQPLKEFEEDAFEADDSDIDPDIEEILKEIENK